MGSWGGHSTITPAKPPPLTNQRRLHPLMSHWAGSLPFSFSLLIPYPTGYHLQPTFYCHPTTNLSHPRLAQLPSGSVSFVHSRTRSPVATRPHFSQPTTSDSHTHTHPHYQPFGRHLSNRTALRSAAPRFSRSRLVVILITFTTVLYRPQPTTHVCEQVEPHAIAPITNDGAGTKSTVRRHFVRI